MRISPLRALAALAVAGLAAACADAPTMAAPERAVATPQPARLNQTGGPITVAVSCSPYAYRVYDCTATASGGSGGYTFAWQHASSEYYEQGNTSKALVSCITGGGSHYGGTYTYSYLAAVAVVRDSQGNANGSSYTGPYTC